MSVFTTVPPENAAPRAFFGGTSGILGGVVFLAAPLLFDLDGAPLDVRYYHVLFVVAVILLIAATSIFYEEYAPAYSPIGKIGILSLGLGLLLLLPFSLGEVIAQSVHRFFVYFVLLATAVVLGLGAIGVGIDSLRTDVPGRWFSIWFPVTLLLPFALLDIDPGILDWLWLGNNPTAAIFGLAWIGMGVALLRTSRP